MLIIWLSAATYIDSRGGPLSHGKSECQCRSRGVAFADASAPAGLNPDLFVVIWFSFRLPKFLLGVKEKRTF